jgi:hypothetical protein
MPGIAGFGDVLVNQTADGVPLEHLWEIEEVVRLWNAEKTTIANLVSYPTTVPADAIPQSLVAESFDEASEYGVPTAMKPPLPYLKVGYTLKDYDKATRFTWKFLRDATAEQVRAQVTRILEGDARLRQGLVLDRLFSPVEGANEWQHRVFGLWNGTDGLKPPDFMGKTFTTGHVHYLVSGATGIDSQDVELAMNHVTEHGYGLGGGRGQLLILANPVEAEAVMSWRAGVTNANTQVAKYDFIPSTANVPAYLTDQNVVGALPPKDVSGVPVLGSYGGAWLLKSNVIPQGYFAVVSSGGPNSDDNPIALRQHENRNYQGLRIIPGNQQRYPLIESLFARAVGVGTRHRGAAVVVQCKAAGGYDVPVITL